jgi:hypothetical protein
MPYPSSQYNNLKNYTITSGMTVWIDPGKNNSYDPANTRILDLSGNNNHLNLVNGPSVLLDQFGGILKFDGTSDWAYITNNPTINFPGDFTVESWEFRPNVPNGFLGSIQKRGYTWTLGGWSTLALGGDYDSYTLGWRNFNASNDNYTYEGGYAGRGDWYHFVITKDQGYIKLYINGELQSTRTTIDNYNYTNTENLEIARWGTVPAGDFSFGPVRIYQFALTGLQVKNHYFADVSRFSKSTNNFHNTLSFQEVKNFNYKGAPLIRSKAKYATDMMIGNGRTQKQFTDIFADLNDQFSKFSNNGSPKFRLSTAYNAMTADQKDYFSNVSQETINNAFEDLDELNKLTTELQRTILLLKSQTLTLDGVYPSSKYR